MPQPDDFGTEVIGPGTVVIAVAEVDFDEPRGTGRRLLPQRGFERTLVLQAPGTGLRHESAAEQQQHQATRGAAGRAQSREL